MNGQSEVRGVLRGKLVPVRIPLTMVAVIHIGESPAIYSISNFDVLKVWRTGAAPVTILTLPRQSWIIEAFGNIPRLCGDVASWETTNPNGIRPFRLIDAVSENRVVICSRLQISEDQNNAVGIVATVIVAVFRGTNDGVTGAIAYQ